MSERLSTAGSILRSWPHGPMLDGFLRLSPLLRPDSIGMRNWPNNVQVTHAAASFVRRSTRRALVKSARRHTARAREISSSAYGASYLDPTQIEPARRPICHSRAICKRKFDLVIPIPSHRFDLYAARVTFGTFRRGVPSGEGQGQRRRLDGGLGRMR